MIKSQKFWSKLLKKKVKLANDAIEKGDFIVLKSILDDLLDLLKDAHGVDWKDRVAICFIIEQLSDIESFEDEIIAALRDVLEVEEDAHVKEFALWALGKVAEKSESLETMRSILPIIEGYLNDAVDQVRLVAAELKERFDELIRQKELDIEKIIESRTLFSDVINKSTALLVSKYAKLIEIVGKIKEDPENGPIVDIKKNIDAFMDEINGLDNEIIGLEKEIIAQIPSFKGESKELMAKWCKIRDAFRLRIDRLNSLLRILSHSGEVLKIIDNFKKAGPHENNESELNKIPEIFTGIIRDEIIPHFILEDEFFNERKKVSGNPPINSDDNSDG